MLAEIVAILFLLFVFVGIPISVWREYVKSNKKAVKEKAEDDAWLAEEMKKPKSRLAVTVRFVGVIASEEIEPKLKGYRSRWRSHRLTSKELAEDYALIIARGDIFRHGTECYPHSAISKVEVV